MFFEMEKPLNSQTLRFLLVIKSLLTQLSGYGAYNPAPEIKIFPPPKGGGNILNILYIVMLYIQKVGFFI